MDTRKCVMKMYCPVTSLSITQVGGEQNTLELSLDVTAHKVFAYRLS